MVDFPNHRILVLHICCLNLIRVPNHPNLHPGTISVAPKPPHTTTPMRVTYKGIVHLRTLCSKETPGGSTYIKHTAGSAGLSQPVSPADSSAWGFGPNKTQRWTAICQCINEKSQEHSVTAPHHSHSSVHLS